MANDPSTDSPSPAPAAGLGEFRINAPSEVQALLRLLLEQQTRVTLGNAAGANLPASLCALDVEQGVLGLALGPGETQLQMLLGGGEVQAVAYLDQIRLQFELEGLISVGDSRGAPMLRAALPTQLWRFQRRQAYRVRPNKRTPQATLTHPQTGNTVALRVVDISVGGLALLLPLPSAPASGLPGAVDAPDNWQPGLLLPARVELDRHTIFQAALRLQHVNSDSESGKQLGLAFAQIDAAAERDLQRYIEQTQKLTRLLYGV
jgi:flagellar brake protein